MALSTAVFVGDAKEWIPELVEKAKKLKVNAGMVEPSPWKYYFDLSVLQSIYQITWTNSPFELCHHFASVVVCCGHFVFIIYMSKVFKLLSRL